MSRGKSIWKLTDKYLLGFFLGILLLGLMTIFSSTYEGGDIDFFDFSTIYGKQAVWVLISVFFGVFIMLLEGQFIKNSSYVVYLIVILLLIGVLFMPSIKGVRSWFQFGSVSIQPSEFAKLACSLAVAKYLSSVNVKIQDFKTRIVVLLLLAVPAFLILMQPDAGTMLVFFAFIFVMYREGLSGNVLLYGFFAVLIVVIAIFLKASETENLIFGFQVTGNMIFVFVLLLLGAVLFAVIKLLVLPRYRKPRYKALVWSLLTGIAINLSINYVYDSVFKERHRTRFQIMFGIVEDRRGDGYNMWQALSAIGSGGNSGKGFLNGTLSNNKYKHVPEQSTDFIFCSFAEEWGFIGCLFFIIIYLAMLVRIIMISERQRSKFTRIFGYCTASILFFHFMINIGMVIGLAPVIGIPLPFFSKGGSAVLTFSILIFVFMRLDAERQKVLR
ncbi:MAG: rod shape-determining protein RodA [Crocinitomicaceae bacterium]|nr:rod shape-determining protein RodA [Crocinitomicaceae bacterium]|tara:strand:- start:1024 stop:2352 length:1329 start_codon:yes stop_codon:yes gene_type:complete